MDSAQGGPSAVTGESRRSAWAWAAAITVVVLVGAVAAFVWWGSPRLAEGDLVAPGAGMSSVGDGVTDPRMMVRGRPVDTVSATFSIRNDGPMPFTVRGLDVTNMVAWLTRQRVAFVPGTPGSGSTATPLKRVTLKPAQQATVLWSLDMACQPIIAEGGTMTIDSLAFEVSWMGLGTSRAIPLRRPIAFTTDSAPQPMPGPDCAD